MEKVTGSVYGIKKPEPNDSGFPCSGGTNILTLASLGQDGRYWGLLNSSQSISEIAFQLGFDYPQYFSRLFKQKTGTTPLEYRNLN